MKIQHLFKTLIFFCLATLTQSCGQKEFLDDLLKPSRIVAGDILIVSGGTVLSSATPFPLHQVSAYHYDGTFKKVLAAKSNPNEMFMGATFDLTGRYLRFTIDNVDRVSTIDLQNTSSIIGNHILDTTNLTGTTLRTVASLSDGGTIVAESTASIEKYDSTGTRVAVGFPIVLTANIMKLRKISGGRFAAVTTGGDDRVRIYNDAGTLQTQINTGLACGVNCDPTDITELSDGRFVISYQIAAAQSLQIYDSSFTYIGQYYLNTTILPSPNTIARTHDNFVIACTLSLNTCEKFQTIGSSGVRVGSTAFIADASTMRQPTDILVVP